jgi:hypothetical protein
MPYKDVDKAREHHKQYNKKWYLQHKEVVIEKKKRQQREIHDWYRKYKSTLCCVVCGESHPACLQFHHKDRTEKKFALGDVASRATSMKALKEEISKCEVLCVNCHAKHHWRESCSEDDWEGIFLAEE